MNTLGRLLVYADWIVVGVGVLGALFWIVAYAAAEPDRFGEVLAFWLLGIPGAGVVLGTAGWVAVKVYSLLSTWLP